MSVAGEVYPGALDLRGLRAAPAREGERLGPLPAYEPLARRVTDFLFRSQVVAVDVLVPLAPGRDGALVGVLTTRLLRRVAEPVQVRFTARPEDGAWRVWSERAGEWHGPLGEGEFFRVDLAGRVTGLRGFRGVRPSAGGLRALLKAGLRGFRPTARAMVKARQLAFERLPAFELSQVEGVTWRLRRIDPTARQLGFEAYDAGGIYDVHMNSEGVRLPPQVAGNHYAFMVT